MVAPYDTWTIVNWDRPLQPNGAILSYTVLFTDNLDENDASGMSSLVTKGNSSRIRLSKPKFDCQLPFSSLKKFFKQVLNRNFCNSDRLRIPFFPHNG